MTIQVSVVVPTYKRPQLLDRCLHALHAQDFEPAAYEIIVVDDAACAKTERLVQIHAARANSPTMGPSIRYLRASGTRGPAAARNLGWRNARGRIIAFTDDDCLPAPTWLRSGLEPFRHNGHLGVMGRVVVPLPSTPTDYQLNESRMQQSVFLTANCFYRREALQATGGFDERFTAAWREDSDLLFTLFERYDESQHYFTHAPEAIVYHPPREASWGVSVKQQRKSMYNALLYKKHPQLYRQLIQPSPPWHYYAIVASGMVGIVAGLLEQRRPLLLAVLLWMLLTIRFCLQRLQRTSRSPGHVSEMMVTSILIPPLSIFWRLIGAIRYRVFFL